MEKSIVLPDIIISLGAKAIRAESPAVRVYIGRRDCFGPGKRLRTLQVIKS